jgi:sulfoxide reductase heme-binding subunit YedZ
MKPWTDRSGRLSYLKLATLTTLLAPAAWMAWQFETGLFGPLPIDGLIDQSGRWAIRILLLSLLVTPMMRIADWPRLILVRRMIGIGALSYAGLHLFAYTLNQNLDLLRVASEIAQRLYLTLGFSAVIGLAVLGATSSDAMIRRMGRSWRNLHRIVYVIAAVGITHFLLQAKIDATEPTLMAGLFILLMAYRVVAARRVRLTPLVVLAVAAVSALLTAGMEFGWYRVATGVNAMAVLQANLAFPILIRPAPVVLLAGSALALIRFLRNLRGRMIASATPARA